jgi:hypothetical protein
MMDEEGRIWEYVAGTLIEREDTEVMNQVVLSLVQVCNKEWPLVSDHLVEVPKYICGRPMSEEDKEYTTKLRRHRIFLQNFEEAMHQQQRDIGVNWFAASSYLDSKPEPSNVTRSRLPVELRDELIPGLSRIETMALMDWEPYRPHSPLNMEEGQVSFISLFVVFNLLTIKL